MLVTIFRSRLRADVDMAALADVGQRMHELATAMPGFIAYKDYTAEDGENVTVVEFATEDGLRDWRNHPEHVAAQDRGRREFFSDYHIQVCRVERAYAYDAGSGQRTEIDPDA